MAATCRCKVLSSGGELAPGKLKTEEGRVAIFTPLRVNVDHQESFVIAVAFSENPYVVVRIGGPPRTDLLGIARSPLLKLDGGRLPFALALRPREDRKHPKPTSGECESMVQFNHPNIP